MLYLPFLIAFIFILVFFVNVIFKGIVFLFRLIPFNLHTIFFMYSYNLFNSLNSFSKFPFFRIFLRMCIRLFFLRFSDRFRSFFVATSFDYLLLYKYSKFFNFVNFFKVP